MWAMQGARSKEIGEGLNQWVREQGRTSILCADASRANQSEYLRIWCERRGVKLEFSPPFHHASIDFVECFNQTLLHRIQRMRVENRRNFKTMVAKAMRVCNETPLDRTWELPYQLG